MVSLASDLILQVQCLAEDRSGIGGTSWQYRNRTEVPVGLQAFGVSQDTRGVLRIYPVTELTENRFLCSHGNEELRVTFSYGKNTL